MGCYDSRVKFRQIGIVSWDKRKTSICVGLKILVHGCPGLPELSLLCNKLMLINVYLA